MSDPLLRYIERRARFRKVNGEWLIEVPSSRAYPGNWMGVMRRDGSIAFVRITALVRRLDRGQQLWRFHRTKAPVV
jgi:hypothetical protein